MNKQQILRAAGSAQEIERGGIHMTVFQIPEKRGCVFFHSGAAAALFIGRGMNVHKGVAWAFEQIGNHHTRRYNGPRSKEVALCLKASAGISE